MLFSVINKKTKKYLVSLFIGAMVCTIAMPIPVRAGVWGETFLSAAFKEILEIIYKQIQSLLLGIGKRLAIGLARDAANRLVAGAGGKKTAFITDYKAYILGVALDEGLLYMNDLLTNVTGGRASAINYVVAGGSLERLGMNYLNILNAEVNAAFVKSRCQYTLNQYSKNVPLELGSGDWRLLNATISNDCNNPLGLSLMIKEETERTISSKQDLAKTRAIAGKGFTGVEVDGKIVSPGSIIAEVTQTTHDEVLRMIGNSKDWGELLASAASAFVNQALQNMYQRGFEEVSKGLRRTLGQVDSKLKAARNDLQKQLGPGSYFLRNANQQLGGYPGQYSGKYTGVQQSIVNFNTQPELSCGQNNSGCFDP